ncbi:uncharacterized protein LOC119350219 [Triticum dicoccoides]|uniref:uncharacterized protein LOC119350219 n=1 Tax=Triticum dicoccoides TaxID=85692 RepID=UPI00188E53F8|nr:uncharacterized protein LOC119350219 [Triticum dicoccoides]
MVVLVRVAAVVILASLLISIWPGVALQNNLPSSACAGSDPSSPARETSGARILRIPSPSDEVVQIWHGDRSAIQPADRGDRELPRPDGLGLRSLPPRPPLRPQRLQGRHEHRRPLVLHRALGGRLAPGPGRRMSSRNASSSSAPSPRPSASTAATSQPPASRIPTASRSPRCFCSSSAATTGRASCTVILCVRFIRFTWFGLYGFLVYTLLGTA